MAGIASTDWTWSVQLADLDNDGWLDLFGTNGTTHKANHSDIAKVAKSIQDPIKRANYWRAQGLQKESNFTYRNLGDLKFQNISREWGLDYEGVSYGAALADLDLDGDLDLAITSISDPIRIYRNHTQTGNFSRIRLHGKERNTHALGAKVTLTTDNGQTLVRYLNSCQGYVSSNEPILHFGLGKAKSIESLTVRWPTGEEQSFQNVPVNHFIEIRQDPEASRSVPSLPQKPPLFTSSNALAHYAHKENLYDDYKAQPLLPHKLSKLGPGLALGDVDADGDTDLYIGGASKQPGHFLLNDGAGGFEHSEQVPIKAFYLGEDMGAVFFDADQDQDLDLFVNSGGADIQLRTVFRRDRLHHNDGKGNLRLGARATENHRDSSGPVAPADFDKDGDMDLFIGGRVLPGNYPKTPVSRLLVNVNGVFSDQSARVAPGIQETGMVTAALWTDVDNDTWLDLLIAHEWGPVQVWKNEKGILRDFSQEAGTKSLHGWWTSISGADIDRDGDIDYAVGNLGLNTKYHPTKEHPWIAYYGIFGNSDKPRFVEAKYEHGTLLPIRGKSCSTAAIPSLATKFTTFQKFARATLPEIYAAPRLAAAEQFEIHELASGIFRNDGTGKLTFEKLPRITQVSAVFGTAFADVDADGHMDLCLAQNFYSTQPETGNVDGGIGMILQGNPEGKFIPLDATKSGFILRGDAKALAAGDFNQDGRPDLVASRNNQSPALFINSNVDGTPFAVQVKGNSGIGARIQLELSDGSSLIGETHTSSGYLTGTDNTLFFGIPGGTTVKSVSIRDNQGKTSRITSGTGPRLVIEESSY